MKSCDGSKQTLTVSQLEVRPLTPVIGAEIQGVDLRQSLTPALRDEIYAALLAHKVIFFRDQKITREQQLDFAMKFGTPEVNEATALESLGKIDAAPVIQPLHFKRQLGQKLGNANRTWHTDSTFYVSPPIGTILRGARLPPVGGDTLFCDAAAAYDGLSDEVKEKIDGKYAFHDIACSTAGGYKDRTTKEQLEELRRKNPPQRHPIVRLHPDTGRKTLNVNQVYVSHIEGMEEEESRELLKFLYSQIEIPEYQVRFNWRTDSVAFWDNRATQHALLNDYVGERHMERVTIMGRWE